MKCWRQLITIALLGLCLSLLINLTVNAQISPSQLVEQAQQDYQSGAFNKSIELLQQASKTYQGQGDNLQQARILSLISLAQQQVGNWEQAKRNIDLSRSLLTSVAENKPKIQVLAQIGNSQGHLELLTGQAAAALNTWQESARLYQQIGDRLGVAGSLIDQAQALGNLGFYRRSCDRILEAFEQPDYRCERLTALELTTIIKQVDTLPQAWQIAGLNSMSNSLLLMGKLSQAQAFIEASQSLNQQSPESSPEVKSKILLSLGNIHKAIALQEKDRENFKSFAYNAQEAINYYHQIEDDKLSKLPAQLNQLSLFIDIKEWSKAQQITSTINFKSDNFITRQNIYAAIKFAHSLTILKQNKIPLEYSWKNIAEFYSRAIKNAHKIGDKRIESSAMGYLGQLQQEQNLSSDFTSQQLIEQALNLAQTIKAPEIAYRWQWELGKIYRQQGNRQKAIAVYQTAIATLKDLRSDLVSLEAEIQFSFREQVEPVYQEFVDLLLSQSSFDQPSRADLETALDVIEALQIAELDNYFQDACLTFKPQNIDKIDPNAAVIYTIVLPDRLEAIISFGDHNLHHHAQAIPQDKLEKTIEQLRQYIVEPDRTKDVQKLSAQMYDWLIKPFEADLANNKPNTLVFVLDSILQTIPMSALYDGKQYLIEKYAIALTPGLRLLNPQVNQVNSEKPSVIAGGISQALQVANQKFSALDSVEIELADIKSNSDSEILLNSQFTEANLAQQLDFTSASIVHLATHGQFSSNPGQTFLLLWQKLLTIQDFSSLLQNRKQALSNPIDLLVLSACETATGDRRAGLGLAGIAVRSGAASTLATLWEVNDDSTAAIMKNFYQQLENNLQNNLQNKNFNKAEALRQAQLQLWNTAQRDWRVPAFWSAYVIVGNWQ
jgi:CHAT domain-containing protein